MLKKFKQATLGTLKTSGVFRLVENSRWRQSRLLILAYHGISLDDEHEWNPSLYITPARFRRRMQLLRDSNCTVLPLGEALRSLYDENLPERSVALTFDDGNYDFLREAQPVLREFDFPATVYLTTYYSLNPRPVFDVICSYLLWKGRNQQLDLKEITGQDIKLDLSDDGLRQVATDQLQRFALDNKLSA